MKKWYLSTPMNGKTEKEIQAALQRGKKDIKAVRRLIGLTEKKVRFNQNKKSLIKAVITREYSL